MLPSAAELVARYLRANNYSETLDRFIQEAGLSHDVGVTTGRQITIEQILQEKKTFDLSLNFEKLGVEDKDHGWHHPAPLKPTVISSLPTKSNVLSVQHLDLVLSTSPSPEACLVVTTADRRLSLIDPLVPSLPLIRSYANFLDSPILDVLVIDNQYLLAASMSGKLLFYDTAAEKVLDERKDHSKYLVKIASWSDGVSTKYVATAGWDSRIILHKVTYTDDHEPCLGEPIASLVLPTIPETILFVSSPDSTMPTLLLTRRDSTHLHYYALPTPGREGTELFLLGKQNLAPHSNAWIAFSPSDVQLCPTDPSLVAVATSSTPHMKLLIVKLLIPPHRGPSASIIADPTLTLPGTLTQTSQARAELLIQDREEAAIVVNVNTMAPQTAYSTPNLAWRPDGSGVFVSSDDGIIRGFEAATGKLMTNLDKHEGGSKLRCLWAGYRQEPSHSSSDQFQHNVASEYLISGGFDQRLIIWTIE